MLVQLTVRRGIPVCATVASYQEASEAVRKFIGNKPSSMVPTSKTGLIADGGEIVAHVSYNGRVWAGRPTDWKPGTVPLYDPRVS
jgi:hypothetical protein